MPPIKNAWKRIKQYYDSLEFIHNKYNHLLTMLLVMFLTFPLVEVIGHIFPISGFLLLGAIILTLRVVVEDKKHLYVSVTFAILAYALNVYTNYRLVKGFHADLLLTLTILIYSVFLAYSITILIFRLIKEKHIKGDTVKGGIAVYFLIGLLWAFIYALIAHFDPAAFIAQHRMDMRVEDFLYYSFVVLTTTGFGDIVPVNLWAASFTNLEAIAGQMFVAIFISRLIGIFIAQERAYDRAEKVTRILTKRKKEIHSGELTIEDILKEVEDEKLDDS